MLWNKTQLQQVRAHKTEAFSSYIYTTHSPFPHVLSYLDVIYVDGISVEADVYLLGAHADQTDGVRLKLDHLATHLGGVCVCGVWVCGCVWVWGGTGTSRRARVFKIKVQINPQKRVRVSL